MEIEEALGCALETEDGNRVIVASRLGIKQAMVSHYLTGKNTPSLKVAARLWGEYGMVVEPYTEKAVIKTWGTFTDVGI